MNKTIRRAAVFSLLLVLAPLVRATWVQAYEAKALANDEQSTPVSWTAPTTG